MAFDSTITEHELDSASQQTLAELRGQGNDSDPDLAVDGMGESILSRLLGLFGR